MDAFVALGEVFGPDLTLARMGSGARFTFDGQAAIVKCGPDGVIRAIFEDRPSRDVAMDRTWIARYRPLGSDYALTASGGERLARDVADFFRGVREPHFAFTSLV